jgi:hypothetical protein
LIACSRIFGKNLDTERARSFEELNALKGRGFQPRCNLGDKRYGFSRRDSEEIHVCDDFDGFYASNNGALGSYSTI